MATPHKCPVCSGSGVVLHEGAGGVGPIGFSTTAGLQYTSNCRACGGRGILWDSEAPPGLTERVEALERIADAWRLPKFPSDGGESAHLTPTASNPSGVKIVPLGRGQAAGVGGQTEL